MRFYSNPSWEADPEILTDVETFYRTVDENREFDNLDGAGFPMPTGWYYWYCIMGCLPDSEPFGPFETEALAIEDAQNSFLID